MLVATGARDYGRVRSFAGEYAVTQFAHLSYLPFVPMGSRWVTGRKGQIPDFWIRTSWKSLAAAYLRVYGPIPLFVVPFVGLTVESVLSTTALVALVGWSWTWRRIWTRREKRRAVVHLALFGTACDPLLMTRSMAERLHGERLERFEELSGGKTAADVARLGAKSFDEAIAAYAVLRTAAAIGRGAAAREARALSERALDAHHTLRAGEQGGPYRQPA